MNALKKQLLFPIIVFMMAAFVFVVNAKGSPTQPMLIMLGILVVLAIVGGIHEGARRQNMAMILQTNVGFRAFAKETGLEINEPLPKVPGKSESSAFVEAHGTYHGVRVRMSVDYVATDSLMTALSFFPDRSANLSLAADVLIPLVDKIAHHNKGLVAHLARKKRGDFWKTLFLSYDTLPENNSPRLRTVLDRACALL